MNRINIIKKKIASIESTLSELKAEVDYLEKESSQQRTQITRTHSSEPNQDELRDFYNYLYSKYISGNAKEPLELLKSKSVSYLGAFCKANGLPIDMKKASKDKAIGDILQWFAQRKAITQNAR